MPEAVFYKSAARNLLIHFFPNKINWKHLGCFFITGLAIFCFAENAQAIEEPPLIPVDKPPVERVWIVEQDATITVQDAADDLPDFTGIEEADSSGLVTPGDYVRIKTGTYVVGAFASSGEAGSEIVWEPYEDDEVTIEVKEHTNPTKYSTISLQATHIMIDGGPQRNITVQRLAGSTRGVLHFKVQSNHILVRRVKVVGPTTADASDCSSSQFGGVGFNLIGYPDINVRNIRIYNNLIEYCGHKGIYVNAAVDSEIRNNIIRYTEATALQINPHQTNDGIKAKVDNLIISGNLIYDNGSDICTANNIYIQSTSGGDYIKDLLIYNNFLWGSNGAGFNVSPSANFVTNLAIYNNTIFNNRTYGFSTDGTPDGNEVKFKNNIVSGNGSSEVRFEDGFDYDMSNNIYDDPGFISTDPTSPDFLKISDTSPAKDTGTDLSSTVAVDFFGTGRPQDGGFDMGAHEYTDGSLTPINGECGPDSGQALDDTPTNLCQFGSATTPNFDGDIWTWDCLGINGGADTDPGCEASLSQSVDTDDNDNGGAGSGGSSGCFVGSTFQ